MMKVTKTNPFTSWVEISGEGCIYEYLEKQQQKQKLSAAFFCT